MKRADDESSLVHPISIARFVQPAFQALHAFASKTDQGVQPLLPVLLRKGQPFRRSGKLRRLVPKVLQGDASTRRGLALGLYPVKDASYIRDQIRVPA